MELVYFLVRSRDHWWIARDLNHFDSYDVTKFQGARTGTNFGYQNELYQDSNPGTLANLRET